MTRLRDYKTILFDCDGVLLDSNEVKSRAFFELALPYGVDAATRFVEDHRARGGVSRFVKIREFFSDILGRTDGTEEEQQHMLASYSEIVRNGLLDCPETRGARTLLNELQHEGANSFVVSGSAEDELAAILQARGLERYFLGVFGSPRNKHEILQDLVSSKQLRLPAVFIGDSRVDYETARSFSLDFVMVTDYSDWKDAQTVLVTETTIKVTTVDHLEQLK